MIKSRSISTSGASSARLFVFTEKLFRIEAGEEFIIFLDFDLNISWHKRKCHDQLL